MATAKLKPATITVFPIDGDAKTFPLSDEKDWAVMFADEVLEVRVKATACTYYFTIDQIDHWVLSPPAEAPQV